MEINYWIHDTVYLNNNNNNIIQQEYENENEMKDKLGKMGKTL